MARLSILTLLLAVASATTAHGQEILPAPPAAQPNPFAALPEGTVIGPSGPVMPGPPPAPKNSVIIPPLDAETVWTQMVDVVDDYFKIAAEQRVVFSNGVPAEGRIDTFPQTGSTLLEPWRGDSIGFRERLEATLQSIRRIGTMRLSPDPGGWRIEAVVRKELENMPRPMMATTGGASFRNDDSLYRDPLLEQRMLSKLLTKLGVAAVPQAEPYYQPPDGVAAGVTGIPAPAAGPVFGAPIPPEQLPPGAVIVPGPPVPVESLPLPK